MAESTQDPAREEHIRAYIDTTRQHFATYHNHKEQMAFVITALYLTGIGALIVQKETAWATTFSYCVTNILVTVFSALALSFVWWQLSNRSFSENIVAALDRLRVQWIENLPENLKTLTVIYKGVSMPQFLKDEIERVSLSKSTWMPTILTILAIIAGYILLLLRIRLIVHP